MKAIPGLLYESVAAASHPIPEVEEYRQIDDVDELNNHFFVQPNAEGWLEYQIADDVRRFVPLYRRRLEYEEDTIAHKEAQARIKEFNALNAYLEREGLFSD